MGSGRFSCHDGPVTATTPAAAAPPRVRGRLTRSTDGRLVAGVASGIAEHLGVDVWVVRTAFVLLAFVNGAGVIAYGALWVLVPQSGGFDPLDEADASARGRASTADRPW